MEIRLGEGNGKKVILIKKDSTSDSELLKEARSHDWFKAEKGDMYGNPMGEAELLYGVGKAKDAKADGAAILGILKKAHVKEAVIDMTETSLKYFRNFLEGIYEADYSFDRYKEKKPETLEVLSLLTKEDYSLDFAEIKGIMMGQSLTKDLVNTRSNDLYPQSLARICADELVPLGVEVEVYDKEDIEKIGMKAFLEVARGSHKEPRLIVMQYRGDKDSDVLTALVGKGLTYDSGGYAIKTTDGMYSMFTDMAGAATVIGAMKAFALNQVKRNVTAVVAACENMIDGGAYRNGDIIGSLLGKTIEVMSTDAEGRLTLADAVTYTEKRFQPTVMLDVATLTGAAAMALGSVALGAYANDDAVLKQLMKASQMARENAWPLPNFPEYREKIKSKFADLKNSGGPGAGATTAAMFIEEFIEDTPWVHLDIAGTSFNRTPEGNRPAGATGFSTKMIYHFTMLTK